MPGFRVIFLAVALIVTSGYTFRCGWLCTDQTGIQDDYVEQRDRCRANAQLKVDTSSTALDDKASKAQLVSSFSECMAQNGWTVPDGKAAPASGVQAAPVAASTPFGQSTIGSAHPPAPVPVAAPAPAEEKASLARAGECAFAQQSADVSTIAAARAKACDLECEQALKAAPEAPRPAACPASFKDSLAKGAEKE